MSKLVEKLETPERGRKLLTRKEMTSDFYAGQQNWSSVILVVGNENENGQAARFKN